MKHNLIRTALVFVVAVVLFQTGIAPVAAQQSILPKELADLLERFPGGAGLVDFVTDNVRLLLAVLWMALIIASVVYAAIAGFKYVSSQGDAGKIEEAQKAIKSIWMGVGAFFVSIIGMVIIVSIANVGVSADVYETCFLGAGSEGCRVCNEEGLVEGNLCEFCEEEYDIKAIRGEYSVDDRCR